MSEVLSVAILANSWVVLPAIVAATAGGAFLANTAILRVVKKLAEKTSTQVDDRIYRLLETYPFPLLAIRACRRLSALSSAALSQPRQGLCNSSGRRETAFPRRKEVRRMKKNRHHRIAGCLSGFVFVLFLAGCEAKK